MSLEAEKPEVKQLSYLKEVENLVTGEVSLCFELPRHSDFTKEEIEELFLREKEEEKNPNWVLAKF